MTDTFSPTERSEIMRRVKGKDTRLELRVRSALHRRGLRFRLGYQLPGKPDLVFVGVKLAVFLDSCFWHGCRRHLRMPKSNRRYWRAKILRNQRRDVQVAAAYRRSGWTLLRFWEHDLKAKFNECIGKIEHAVRTSRPRVGAA